MYRGFSLKFALPFYEGSLRITLNNQLSVTLYAKLAPNFWCFQKKNLEKCQKNMNSFIQVLFHEFCNAESI